MPQHVEFSITDPHQAPVAVESPDPPGPPEAEPERGLERWAATIHGADEPCLIIDVDVRVVAMSAAFEEMLGLGESPVNRPLLEGDAVLRLLDFGDGKALEQIEVARMPSLLAVSSNRLARGLIRIECATGDRTFDAIATPLTEDGKVVGSLTFFSAI